MNCALVRALIARRRALPSASWSQPPVLGRVWLQVHAQGNRVHVTALATWLAFALALAVCPGGRSTSPPPTTAKLLLAFASYRDRPAFTNIYFYEHDGIGQGRLLDALPAAFER